MYTLLTKAKNFLEATINAGQRKVLGALRKLSQALESPQDSAQRIMYLQIQIALVRIGCDLRLFDILAESPTPLSVDVLSQKTGAAPTLLGRVLRYLSSHGVIKEIGKNTFTNNKITKTFTYPGFRGGIYHYHDNVGPAIQALPDFLKENKYQDITSAVDTPLQKAWNTDLPAFIWVQSKPENFTHFNQFMAGGRLGMPTWLDAYPYKEKTKGLKTEQPFFIDVGGGIGHQAVALREKLPELPNKIILQDIPATLEHAIKHPGIEIVAQDLFEPQTITNARIYYMRNIIHDYPDDKAIVILKNTITAMAPDSVILIDDMVLPDCGVPWQATQIDLVMMSTLASQERTHEQWFSLLSKAGLKINKIYTYTASLQDGIIEAVPALM
ncbi:Demethylsterigmatocystin 6-O-methyltransferase [Metarhizium brunneum]|uniref:Demethylsterigmatocystin 6-O-methyltransferase n=1 Tax=Metarhizium brunneum TaxID=500148 RepID=A0A7D5ZCG2_9HYPO|nr:Demethylsterigmatocystin 6-O-methyltransferase [Metarhizium brunneum]